MGEGNAIWVKWAGVAAAGLTVAVLGMASCTGDPPSSSTEPEAAQAREPLAPKAPLSPASGVDDSENAVQRGPHVAVAMPFASRPLREIPSEPLEVEDEDERVEHEPLRSPFPFAGEGADPAIQREAPRLTMPVTLRNFLAQGETLGGCIFPKPDAGEPAPCTTTGDPPDTNGAVGPNHYVQTVNGGIGIWNKDGSVAMAPKLLKTLWAGYTGTNPGNACATDNDGDPVVLYDSLADRWFVTQFSLPNYTTTSQKAPSFQCVAVSQTADPTGAYWLYDYQYNVVINDYGKFGVWPDAYYAAFNMFNPNSAGADACAYDRVSMLAGKPATQHCFQQAASVFGLLPSSVDGPIKPPNGEPGFFVTLRNGTSLGLYKFHADFASPVNATFTGPTSLTVASYTQLCGGGSCVAQPSPGNPLGSLGDRPMFHLSYRNFGTVESLVFNHSVSAGGSGGLRWYEIHSPNGTPTIAQQGTYAPDSSYRWMGSISQDMAQDLALGFSISSASAVPGIGWTGRINSDPVNTMGQGEALVQAGAGVETGNFSNGQTASRWGDYSNMTVDPSNDCTFWYTQELYPANGTFNWDTHVSSFTFPNCGANDFTIGVQPATQNVSVNGTATYTVTTTPSKGTAESITLAIQDLPANVAGAFVPPTVTAGGTSTLTLTATNAAIAAPAPFLVIGKATSAVHAASAQVGVVACSPITTCPAGDNCGTIPDGCGGTVNCGGACVALDACHVAGTCANNVCTNPTAPDGTTCSDGNACTTGDVCTSGACGGTAVVCQPVDQCHAAGACDTGTGQCGAGSALPDGTACTGGSCQAGVCTPTTVDAGTPDSGIDAGGVDAGSHDAGVDAGKKPDAGTDAGGSVDSGAPHDAASDSSSPFQDSGSATDGSSGGPDASEGPDAAGSDGGGGPNPGNSGGCGCVTAGGPSNASLGLSGLGVLAVVAGLRRRRRR